MIGKQSEIWWEKYRPQTLDEMCLSKENRELILEWGESKEIPHLLLLGTPGIGKTTISRILVQNVLNCDYLYLNASDESGIDTIRTKVTGFVQTKSLNGEIKVVILDEGDRLTKSSLDCLRNLMESYSSTSRFIITGNESHKITDAINSRCRKIFLTPSEKDIGKRCLEILKKEGISTQGVTKEAFNGLIKAFYPDVRQCLTALQSSVKDGKLVIAGYNQVDQLCVDILNNIKKGNTLECRKIVIENENSFSHDYDLLMKRLLNVVYESKIEDLLKKQYILVITEYMYRSSFVIDKEINLFACILQMEDITD